jgi:preprotein translocase subunit SecD
LDAFNQPSVSFALSPDAAVRFAAFTDQHVGRLLAIILDGVVYQAPVIEGRVGAEGSIQGGFTPQEAQDLAVVLRSGSLRAPLEYLEQSTIGPTLGADAIRSGAVACAMAAVLTGGFMVAYYRAWGINAVVSMVVNLVILLAAMAYLGVVLTLPGIAGLVLTIGIGVDSSILIFERIKEAIADGETVRAAVRSGFDRVFLTLLDTHIAALIGAAFLFQFGTSAVQGFAVTLSLGLAANMVTSSFVSRTLFLVRLGCSTDGPST